MDPLSITAGIIAILGAATTTTSTISKLRAAGKAPELFNELSNEVEALRSVLTIIRTCLRRVQHSDIEQDVHDILAGLFRNTQDVALELQSMLEYQLRAGEGRTKDGRTKVNRRDWMKYGPEVEKIKQKIRDAEKNLQTGLAALNVIQGINHGDLTRQCVVQIQGIHITQQAQLTAALSSNRQQMLANAAAANQLNQMLEYWAPGPTNQRHLLPHTRQLSGHNQIASAGSMPIPENRSQVSAHIANNDLISSSTYAQPSSLDTMTITATIARRRCHVSCDCACHVRTAGCTPRWLKGVLGQLMFNYTRAIYTRPCTKDSCLKASHKSSFSYHFPSWLAWKTLDFQHHSSGLASYDSTWSLRVDVDISEGDLAWPVGNAIELSNTEAMRELITSGAIHPRMLYDGVPILLYAYKAISYHPYTSRYERAHVPEVPFCNLLRRAGFAVALNAHADALEFGEFAVQHRKELGVDVEDVSDYLRFPAMQRAIVFPEPGDASVSDVIHNNMRDIETPDVLGRTPLQWACATGSLEFVQVLLKVNALPNSRDRSGMTALHHACGGLAEVEASTRLAISETLLIYGADVHAVDKYVETPLHQARDAEISQLLLDHGACVDALNGLIRTPLFCARDAAQVDALTRHGAQLAHIDYRGRTALHLCAVFRRAGVVKALIRHGADIYATDKDGYTPFHSAIEANAAQVLLTLREANERDPRREYPIYNDYGHNYLHLAACFAGAGTIAELLLFDLTGHHPDARDIHGLTAEEKFDFYEDEEGWYWAGLDPPAREERRKAWEALVKKAREQNKDWRIEELQALSDKARERYERSRIEELNSSDYEWTDVSDDSEEETYPMPGSFDTA